MGLLSKICGRSQHSGAQADEWDEPDVPLEQQLLEARAHLAKLKKLPISAFAAKSYKTFRPGPSGLISYSVDNKDDAVARAEAEIAELEILVEGNDLVKSDKEPS